MPNCTIESHHHGAKLAKGYPECISKDGGIHSFTGFEVRLFGHPLPLFFCSKCGFVAAYYRCNTK